MTLPTSLTDARHRYFNRTYLTIVLLAISIGQLTFVGQYAFRAISESFILADWRSPLTAALMHRNGDGSWIYDISTLGKLGATIGIEQSTPYIYPPTYLLVVYPFTGLPLGLANVCWMLFNLGLLVLSVYALTRALVSPEDRWLFALIVGSSLPVGTALAIGQSTFILLLGLTLASIGLLRGKDLWTGLGLAALLIKPQLLPLWILLLLWQRRLRALAYLTLAALLVAALSWLMVGTEGMIGYLRLLTNGTMSYQYSSSHSLMGIAQATGGGGSTGFALYLFLSLSVVGWYSLHLHRASRQIQRDKRDIVALTVLVSILAANYLLVYDLTLWGVVLALVWPVASKGRARVLIAGGFVAPWLAQAVFQSGTPFVWPTVTISLLSLAALMLTSRKAQEAF